MNNCNLLYIFGESNQAYVTYDIIKQLNLFEKIVFVDKIHSEEMNEFGDKIIPENNLKGNTIFSSAIVAIGDNHIRTKIFKKLSSYCLIPISIISKHATISPHVKIADGTQVMPGAIINYGSLIGKNCIINTSASIDHDANIGNHVAVAPGVVMGGNVKIGDGSFIGLGTKIVHNITIGKHCIIGAGSLILKDVPDYSVVYGSPGKITKKHKTGEGYL